MKILLGIPTTGQFSTEFAQRLVQITSVKHSIYHMYIVRSIIHIARENMCDEAIRQGYDAVCFLDDDMIIEPDFIDKLARHNAPIVSAMCFKRTPPYSPCVYNDLQPNGLKLTMRPLEFDEVPTKPFYVDAAGSACMLIKTSLLKQMKKPWFLPLPYAGEDLSFCYRLSQMGQKILVDPTIKVGHLEQRAIYAEHYLKWKRNHGDNINS